LLKLHGYNELDAAQPKSFLKIAAEGMREPMFILLVACSSLYLLLGDYREGFILLGWVIVILLITFSQHRKTEKSLEALRQLSAPRALVQRDGEFIRIPGREVVPSDWLHIREGDRIPADALLMESQHLLVDESMLTGESVPVLKTAGDSSANTLFSGTMVVGGSGFAKVINTGAATRFGNIGASLRNIQKDQTRLQAETGRLIRRLFLAGVLISVGVTAAFYFTRGDLLHAVLSGLSAVMALLPEEFPVVLTVFMALGAWRLARNKVLTRVPAAIETLGSATVLCTDKTGTLTLNKMEVSGLYCAGRHYPPSDFHQYTAELFSLADGLYQASEPDSLDPMERALVNLRLTFADTNEAAAVLKHYPLSGEFKAMTRVVEMKAGRKQAFCKGAPETVLGVCQLSSDEHQQLLHAVEELASQGFRVLAAASCEWNAPHYPEKQQDFPFDFLGLVAFEDPIRPEVPQAIQECRNAGIRVIMLTGDFPLTAGSIAAKIGLENAGDILTGKELQDMPDTTLQQRIREVQVFARIVPEQKLKIIRALKANGEIVAMTGDGVNDAPALKAADIGVAMGMKGTDVAREAASLVLLDDNFASIVEAIRSGRRIFDNLQKAMTYIVAVHLPIIGLVLLPSLFSFLPILLMPLHIVFMELIIDPVCSVAFESQVEEKGIMERPPRPLIDTFFGWKSMAYSLLEGVALLFMVLVVFVIALQRELPEAITRALSFSALIGGNLVLVVCSLSTSKHFFRIIQERNRSLLLIASTAIIALIASLFVPVLKEVFMFETPALKQMWLPLVACAVLLLLLEGLKYFRGPKER